MAFIRYWRMMVSSVKLRRGGVADAAGARTLAAAGKTASRRTR
jgi:hypothetical protein